MLESPVPSLFRLTVACSEAAPKDVDDQLFPEEIEYLRRAVPKRRFEFGTARVCARRALAKIGISPVALVPKSDRSPWWPDEVVGAISHTRDWCAVVVARRQSVRSLGLDIEIVSRIGPHLAEKIVTPKERAFLERQDPSRYEELLTLHFSAKEAYYKCQYPITMEFLGFHEVELAIDLSSGEFCATALSPLPESVREVKGRFAIADGSVYSGIELAP